MPIPEDLIKAACDAEDLFTLEELEEFAEQFREGDHGETIQGRF